MKYIDEYRDRDLIMKLAGQIRRSASGNYTFMEVCGGHTAAIRRFGIPSLLPENIRLISGPGCPVCVTGTDFIDKAIRYSERSDVIIATFGDLLRVPGSESSLEKMKALGADIRIFFSGLAALETARLNPEKKVIFLGIGFETTAPGTALTVIKAAQDNLSNFFVLSAHKIMPPAMEAILKNGTALDGFICPGHVSVITGSSIFIFIPEKYGTGCVITGFEPVDILQAILMLINQVNRNDPSVEIQYKRAVTTEGNSLAQGFMDDVFEKCDATWRGFGLIRSSGLALKGRYERYNAEYEMPVKTQHRSENELCICGDILRGLKTPDECPLFNNICTPENPAGACMVSNEGACNTWFKYRFA
ncbi:MAG TPA: hydrogenase formation protein HypD [Bacteroidales bacterium]|nr:hydrogenase formation protein HypD [Bacteroidales bacterium]